MFKQRYLDASYAVAMSSAGVGGKSRCNHKIGSILVINNRIISAVNSYKTSPRLVQFYEYPHFHAEAKCIFRVGLDECQRHRSGTLYVTRIRKDGSLGSAKPCEECQNLIEFARIKRVIYSNDNGGYESLS
jgi:deoxycytidylate deaminase